MAETNRILKKCDKNFRFQYCGQGLKVVFMKKALRRTVENKKKITFVVCRK